MQPHPNQLGRRMPGRVTLVGMVVGLCTALAGCTFGSTSAPPSPTATATATPTPSCATLMPGATPAFAPPEFAGLTFPPGTVEKTPLTSPGGPGQFSLQETQLCYHGTPDQVNGPFSGHTSTFAYLLGAGWSFGTSFPVDKQTQTPCPSGANCFRSGNPPYLERYLRFENIQAPIAGSVTYTLTFAFPPAAPTCNPTYYGSSVPYIYTFQGFNVPPLTKESDFAAGGGHAGGYTYGLCSAGTPATILTFMQTAVTAAGLTPMNVTATSFQTCQSAGSGFYREWDVNVGSGNEWTLNRTSPIFTTPSC